MNLRLPGLFVLASLLAGSGCATLQDGRESVLKPSMISKDFRDLDKENPFANKATRVGMTVVGIPSYDKFFRESAEVNGTTVLADVVIKETDVVIAKVKRDVGAGKVLTPVQVKQVDRAKARLAAITALLEGVPDRSTKLAEGGEGLTKTAPKTFAGPNAVKLPGVMKGLEQSTAQLKSSATRVPALLKRAASTTEKLASF